MKILMLIDALDVGGAETHVEILADELAKMGNEIIVASTGGKIGARMSRRGIKMLFLPPLSKKTSSKKRKSYSLFVSGYLSAQKTLTNLIIKEKPDLIHAHTRRTAFLISWICKRHKVPLIVTAHAKFSMKFPKNLLSKWGDGTISVSDDIKNHLEFYGAHTNKIKVIHNGVSIPNS